MNNTVFNIAEFINRENYNYFTDEFIVTPIDKKGELMVDYSKSKCDIQSSIEYAKELYKYFKEQEIEIEEIIIDYEITGQPMENSYECENVDTVTILKYKE